MTRVKFCGMTRIEDALLAAQMGVDAIGLVFTARSKRRVTVAQARAIREALPPFVSTVALFMDDDGSLVDEVIASVQPDALQFHGRESDSWCSQFGRPFIKAIAMGEGPAGLARLHDYPHAAALLLDGHGWGEAGGSGRAFDWSLMPKDVARSLVLAGGLEPGNVAGAIRLARPWAVDVASGVEASPGIKDAAKMERFIAAVRQASSPG